MERDKENIQCKNTWSKECTNTKQLFLYEDMFFFQRESTCCFQTWDVLSKQRTWYVKTKYEIWHQEKQTPCHPAPKVQDVFLKTRKLFAQVFLDAHLTGYYNQKKIWEFLRLFAASRDLAITELLWRTGQMLCQNTPHVLHTTRTGRTQNVLCKNIKHSV